MVTQGEKINPAVNNRQPQAVGPAFFRKPGETNFFENSEAPSFFRGGIQPKLAVSQPNDPQEKEADEMAEHVMRMPHPVQASPGTKDEEKLDRLEEKNNGEVQAKPADIHLAAHETKEEEKLRRKEEKEEEQPIHAKAENNALFSVQRSKEKEEEKVHTKCEACRNDEKKDEQKVNAKSDIVSSTYISRKNISLHRSDVLQLSGRGPPADSIPFEQSLSSSKGGGSALPENTRQFMETRFNADFSGVRVHTGSYAEGMASNINAQAFAHGKDIYFNQGKYAPETSAGGLLLAHELTHTIQQGASKTTLSSQNAAQAKINNVGAKSFSISKKEMHGSVDTIPEETLRTPPKTKEANTTANDDVQAHKNKLLQPNNLSTNTNPKTLRDLRKELFKVDRQEIHDEAPQIKENIQSKTELSKWHVNAEGHLQKSADPVPLNDNKKFQRKEEKENKEEEKQVLFSQPDVQKKQAEEIQSKYDNSVSNEGAMQTSSSTHTQTEITKSSLNNITDGSTSVINNKQDRGPPSVQLKSVKGGFVIQRSWLSSAWNAVSGAVGEAAAFVERGLDAAKEWILGKIKSFVQNIPGYNILGLILQQDPITHEPVERSGRNILLAGLQLIPGGSLFRQVLERVNAIDEAGAWIDARIGDLLALVSGIGNRFTQFIDHLSLDDIRNPEGVLNRVAELFKGVFNDVVGFMTRAAGEFLEMIKRIMLRLIVDFVRDKIPRLYPLLRVALGHDPVTGEDVPRNGHNILYAVLDATDDGREQRKQMEDTGSFDKAAAWIDRGIAVFTTAYSLLRQAFTNLWANVTIDNLFSPIETFNRIYADFAAPVNLVKDFLIDVAKEIIRLIKDALLKRLRDYARGTKGYYLVTVIIGKDPFTGEVVPRTVANIIHGFMSLMDGGEEQYRQMEESGAIARTTQQIEAAVARLNMTPEYIIGLFIKLWHSFGLKDLAHPIDAFTRIVHEFGEPIGRLIDFVIEIIKIVIHVILEIMNFPFDLINNIIAKAIQAFELIKKDPIGFLKNLLRAIKQGFVQFFGNILTHLVNGLKAWFLSEVQAAGIPIPTDFSVMGIIKWLLAVLDITMEKIWKKLEERIGKPKVDKIKSMIATAQRVAGAAGDALAFMEDVQRRGFMAVMIDKMKEQLSNVWELVLDAVKSFVLDQIIKKATAKLLSMLDPTGIMAVINSAIALYKAIQSFKRYLQQMLEIVNSFVEGTLQIAQGATKNAADFLEGALARGIPIVIGFLANQVGLNLSERLKDALELVREKVDKGLTWVIDKVVIIIEKVVSFGKAVVASLVEWWKGKKKFTANDGKVHQVYLEGDAENAVLTIKSDPQAYTNFLKDYESKLGAAANEEVTVGSVKKTKSGVISEAKVIAGDLEKEKKKEISAYAGADDKAKEEQKKNAIDGLLQRLADISVPLFGTDKPLDSEIVLPAGSNNNDFAKSVEVVNIYKTPKVINNGSEPTSAKHAIYDIIDNRQKGNASYYIRGHLVNHNIGGPGMWNNMTGLSRTGNSNHESQVESKIKAAFDTGAVIRYKVIAEGNQSPKTPTATDKNQFTKIADFDKNFKLLESIINAEVNVPRGLYCEAHTRKKEGSAWIDDKEIVNTSILNPVETSYDSYELGDNVQPAKVNLNTAGADQLARLASIGSVRAEKIIGYRATTLLKPPATKFFEKIEDLNKIDGIGGATIAALKSDPLIEL